MKYLLAFASAISLSVSARAATFTIFDGVNPLISVSDNAPGDENSAPGAIVVQTNIGVWALTINTAITKPLIGSATDPVMDINLQAFSTAAGSLTLTFSDNNFGPASGTLNATMTGNTVFGPAATAGMDVYGDPANIVGATTLHLVGMPQTPLVLLSQTTSGTLNMAPPFALTEIAQVNASGSSLINVDASFNVTAVPEPGIVALGSVTLTGWALFRVRSRRA
jgi:hypothetical protein